MPAETQTATGTGAPANTDGPVAAPTSISSDPLSMADFAAKIRKRDPRLTPQLVDDATLVRKVLERKPELVKYVQTSEPRPKLTNDRKLTAKERVSQIDKKEQEFFEQHPLIREAALGIASGAGIPESQTPVKDIGKGIYHTVIDQPQSIDEKAAMYSGLPLPVYRVVKGLIQQAYGFGSEVFDSVDWNRFWKEAKEAKHSGIKDLFNPTPGVHLKSDQGAEHLVHGLAGLSTMILGALKGPEKVGEAGKVIAEGAEKVKSAVEPTVRNAAQSMTGTGKEPIITAVRERATENRGHVNAHEVDVERTAQINEERQAAHAKDVAKVEQENAERKARYDSRVADIQQRYAKRVAVIKEKYAGDVKARESKVAELIAQHEQAVTKAREDWVRESYNADKSNVGFQGQGGSDAAKAEAVKNKRAAMQRAQESYTEMIDENVKHTHEAVRGSLDRRWDAVRDTVGRDTPLDSTKLKDAVDAGRKKLQGAPADLKVFNDLMRQMETAEDGSPMGEVDQASGKEPVIRPLTWEEGRTHYSAIGDKLYSGELPGNVAHAIKTVREALDGELESAAVKSVTEKQGAAAGAAIKKEYGQLKKDWSRYETDWRDLGSKGPGTPVSPLAGLLRALDKKTVSSYITGKFGDRLLMTFARYDKFGASPGTMSRFRNLVGEEKALPKVKAPEAPGKFTAPEAPKIPDEVPAPKIPEPHRVPDAPKPKETPDPPKLAEPKPLKVEPPVQAFETRLKRLEQLAGDPTSTWKLWRKGVRWLLTKEPIREWIASQARDVDPDYIPPAQRDKLSPVRQQQILKDAVKEYRMLDSKGQTSLRDYLKGTITREGLRQRTQALFPEVPATEIEEYLDSVDKGKGIVKPNAAPKTYQPPPNTPEATAWHNEAMEMAKKKLGPSASASMILQEAAKIQQAGKPVQ